MGAFTLSDRKAKYAFQAVFPHKNVALWQKVPHKSVVKVVKVPHKNVSLWLKVPHKNVVKVVKVPHKSVTKHFFL